MITITDQTGQTIALKTYPQKIISVVPSQTELLYSLGLDKETIGITKFCIHPDEWFKSKTRVGGTKTLNLEIIRQLGPDIILANKEENTEEQVKALCKDYPVYISDIKNLDDALKMIEDIGLITNRITKAKEVTAEIKINFSRLTAVANFKSCYLIWQKPYMAAGGDTFINDMMKRCGLINVLAHKNRYPETTIEELNTLNCELMLLASEPFPFKEKHMQEVKANGFKGKIMLVDGEMFSWYGSRLLQAPGYFQQLVNSVNSV
jgi:ABC-type Fe3+-hydroxamate transport system substrate-binding protein